MFGERKPPASAQTAAASGVARYSRSAMAAFWFLPSLRTTAASPPLTTGASPPPTAGNGKKFASSPIFLPNWSLATPADEVALVDHARLGLGPEDLLDRAGEVGAAGRPSGRRRSSCLSLKSLPRVVSALTTRRVGPLDLVGGERRRTSRGRPGRGRRSRTSR